MKKAKNSVSLRTIARVAGVSSTAVGFALQNQPGVSLATKEHILGIARQMGYAPDARLGGWMARVRGAAEKELLPIAWLNTDSEKDAWHRQRYLTPFLEGGRERALELGYKLEEVWAAGPGMTMRRLGNILYRRGIEGAIICGPARHIRLNWDHLASVALEGALLAPRLHRITADINFNLLLALKSLTRLGHRRIGICLAQELDTASLYSVRATAHHFQSKVPRAEQIPPLFHPPFWTATASHKERQMAAWLKRYKPRVILGHDNRIEQWVRNAGFRVPEEIGIVHLALDDDVLDWAGIYSRRRQRGRTAVEWLVSLMRNRQFGVPETPLNILIRGSWRAGRTLGSPS